MEHTICVAVKRTSLNLKTQLKQILVSHPIHVPLEAKPMRGVLLS
jgi:hypothetical protein